MQYLYLLIITLATLLPNPSRAEIIGMQNDIQIFGDWKVLCENDVMIDGTYCKIATKFYNDTAAISLEPSSKLANQMIVVIPNVPAGNSVRIRIDKNDIIFSDPIKTSDFNLIPFSPAQKSMILNQMKKGDFLFIRFNITNSEKEITAKISLKDFRDAIVYYNSRISK